MRVSATRGRGVLAGPLSVGGWVFFSVEGGAVTAVPFFLDLVAALAFTIFFSDKIDGGPSCRLLLR